MKSVKTPMPLPSVVLEEKPAKAKLPAGKRLPAALTAREEDALASGAKLIPLTKGQWAIVDLEDYPLLSSKLWNAEPSRNTFYARCSIQGKSVKMHQMIMNSFGGTLLIDHRNGDGLDNRRANLRACAHQQNTFNRGKQSSNTTGFKGVSFRKSDGKFTAQIYLNGEQIYLGSFDTAEAAAATYAQAAPQYHGEFAHDGTLEAARPFAHLAGQTAPKRTVEKRRHDASLAAKAMWAKGGRNGSDRLNPTRFGRTEKIKQRRLLLLRWLDADWKRLADYTVGYARTENDARGLMTAGLVERMENLFRLTEAGLNFKRSQIEETSP